jgi:hypothetical protein
VSADADESWEIPIRIDGVWHQLGPGQTIEAANVHGAKTRQRPPVSPDVEDRVRIDEALLAG